MRIHPRIASIWLATALILSSVAAGRLEACSTFKLQKGGELLYGHNLNQPGMDVPGLIFVNKRGLFKLGRSAGEMLAADRSDPSTLSWISRYGSVTFSTFGRDMPDGGINEAGLYIWEMSTETEYPADEALPRLLQMNWMQYVLDNFSTLDEAIESARRIRIEGWGWHYFLGDGEGRCAAVEFLKGRVVVHRGDDMPVPGLFNAPYGQEVEVARYFRNFGGLYEPVLDDPKIPRFVKTALMIKDYDPSRDAAAYGLQMLKNLKVNDIPDWSVLIDVRRKEVYFRTALNPEVKRFSPDSFDFSNTGPVLVLNMDRKEGGDVTPLFHPATDAEVRDFIAALPIPDDFFTRGGITKGEFADRFAGHYHGAEDPARQAFRGLWKGGREQGGSPSEPETLTLSLSLRGPAVDGRIANAQGEDYPLEQLHLIHDDLSFTFRNLQGTIYIVKARLNGEQMDLQLWRTEGFLGEFELARESRSHPEAADGGRNDT
jgi:penicillin V acylase-like amidase (Ntn superfamily)